MGLDGGGLLSCAVGFSQKKEATLVHGKTVTQRGRAEGVALVVGSQLGWATRRAGMSSCRTEVCQLHQRTADLNFTSPRLERPPLPVGLRSLGVCYPAAPYSVSVLVLGFDTRARGKCTLHH